MNTGKKYAITGMSCAACQSRVEKAVEKIDGVDDCTVSLLLNTMTVKGEASQTEVIKAVQDAGYGIEVLDAQDGSESGKVRRSESDRDITTSNLIDEIKTLRNEQTSLQGHAPSWADTDRLKDRETPKLRKRLIYSVVVLLILMYFSMGHMMFGFPAPAAFDNHVFAGLFQMLLALTVMAFNRKFFTSGFDALLHLSPNMDTLVALGSSVSFGYSLIELFLMILAQGNGDTQLVMHYGMNLYFESAAMIPTLITVGKMLEAMSKGKTTDALKGLMKLAPQTAVIEVNGTEKEVPVSQVQIGDVFICRPGAQVPVDGVIVEGQTAINESSLTGESIPAEKEIGDKVYAATINTTGYIKCKAERVGADTTLAKIIQTVADAGSGKAHLARIADKVSGVFVPTVIVLAVLTFIVWIFLGAEIGEALTHGISVLVISCPCALGLATPVAIMVGSGVGARNGILYKTAAALEGAGRVKVVALDKTGTITKGEPVVTDLLSYECSDEELLFYAAVLEKKSEHPLAKAVVNRANDFFAAEHQSLDSADMHGKDKDKNKDKDKEKAGTIFNDLEVKEFKILPGNGLQGILDSSDLEQVNSLKFNHISESKGGKIGLFGGSYKFISKKISLSAQVANEVSGLAAAGKTPLLFVKNNNLLGIIAVADAMKEDSRQAVREFKEMGLRVVMLTGDNEVTAKAIGQKAGVDEVIAGVLPDEKAGTIRALQNGMEEAEHSGATTDSITKSMLQDRSGTKIRLKENEKVRVAMIGDGINDAPALITADAGIAIGAGADIAIDAAEVVLMKNSLLDASGAITLSKATIRNIHENLFWAFIYNIICIPLAMGVYGVTLKPVYGAAAMSLSSFCVCMNALRLNFVKLHRKNTAPCKKKDIRGVAVNSDDLETDHEVDDVARNQQTDIQTETKINSIQKKETSNMQKEIKIEGMMCAHCEANVKGALEALTAVESAEVSHEKGTAVVTLTSDLADSELTKTVEDKGYTVIAIQ